MKSENERFEALLRQFQPRAPRTPLLLESGRPGVAWWRDRGSLTRVGGWIGMAGAAAAVVFAANLRVMPIAQPTPDAVVGPGLTLNDMRGLLDADAATLDRTLLDASRHVLPDLEKPDSVLGQLAQP